MTDRAVIYGYRTTITIEHADSTCICSIHYTAVDGDLAGAIVVDGIGSRAGADVLKRTAIHNQRTFVSNQVAGIAAAVVVRTVPSPGGISTADQLAGAGTAAIINGQSSKIADQSGSVGSGALTNHLMAVEIEHNVLTSRDSQRISRNFNIVIRNHGDRGRRAVSRDSRDGFRQGGV